MKFYSIWVSNWVSQQIFIWFFCFSFCFVRFRLSFVFVCCSLCSNCTPSYPQLTINRVSASKRLVHRKERDSGCNPEEPRPAEQGPVFGRLNNNNNFFASKALAPMTTEAILLSVKWQPKRYKSFSGGGRFLFHTFFAFHETFFSSSSSINDDI